MIGALWWVPWSSICGITDGKFGLGNNEAKWNLLADLRWKYFNCHDNLVLLRKTLPWASPARWMKILRLVNFISARYRYLTGLSKMSLKGARCKKNSATFSFGFSASLATRHDVMKMEIRTTCFPGKRFKSDVYRFDKHQCCWCQMV